MDNLSEERIDSFQEAVQEICEHLQISASSITETTEDEKTLIYAVLGVSKEAFPIDEIFVSNSRIFLVGIDNSLPLINHISNKTESNDVYLISKLNYSIISLDIPDRLRAIILRSRASKDS